MRLRDRLPNYLTEADILDYETESSYIIYQDGVETIASNSHTGVILSHNINPRVVFNAVRTAMASGGHLVVKHGTYTLDATGGATWDAPDSIWIQGEGPTTILNLNGCNLRIFNVNNVRVTDMKIIGAWSLKVEMNADHHDFVFQNITFNVTGTTDPGALYMWAQNCTISNIWVDKCVFNTCAMTGLILSGGGGAPLVKNFWLTDSYAVSCGAGGLWCTGFDIAEGNNLTDAFVINCKAELSWESGFHVESARNLINVNLVDCISINNNQKGGGSTYGAGFICSKGMKFINCISNVNKYGFLGGSQGTQTTELIDCTDIGSPTGFYFHATGSTGQLIFKNCTSINATTKGVLIQDAYNVYGEFNVITPVSGHALAVHLGGNGIQLRNSYIKVHVYYPDSATQTAVFMNYCINVTIEGDISTDETYPLYISNSTDIVVQNMHINSTGTSGIFLDTTLDSIFIKDTIIENVAGVPALTNGIQNTGTAGAVRCDRESIDIKDVTTPYIACVFKSNWGTSTGTGAEQAINHLLWATPTIVMLTDIELNAIPYQSAAAAADHIHVTAALNQDWGWYVRCD